VAHEAEPSAYNELLAALDDHDRDIRSLAEALLHRTSPRPARTETMIETCEVIAEGQMEDEWQAICSSVRRCTNGNFNVEL
jgi:hypothetical protein